MYQAVAHLEDLLRLQHDITVFGAGELNGCCIEAFQETFLEGVFDLDRGTEEPKGKRRVTYVLLGHVLTTGEVVPLDELNPYPSAATENSHVHYPNVRENKVRLLEYRGPNVIADASRFIVGITGWQGWIS